MPHGHCYLWRPPLVGLHLFSDLLIALAYYSIPITLFYLVRKRQDLPFNWIFLLFGSFIIACGTTHLMEIWTLWHPIYWVSGGLKATTAAISMLTALMLVPIVPQVLALPSPEMLRQANQQLEEQIQERQRIEDALRQSEARYRAIVEDQTDLICRFQPDGTILFVNDAYCRYFKTRKEDVIGQTYAPILYESDRRQVEQAVQSISLENPVVTIENRVVVESQVYWTQWINRAFFDDAGQLVELQSVGRDITERMQAEIERRQAELALKESQRFTQKIADTAPVILYVYDLVSDRNVYINRGVEELLGYTPEEIERMGTSVLTSLLHPEDLTRLSDHLSGCKTAKDGEVLRSEYRMRHRCGEWRYLQLQETVFARTQQGSAQQILGVALDVTVAKQLEESRRTEEKLHLSLKEKEVLINEIHHRVKNNLQMVYSLLRLQYRRTENSAAANILLDSQNRIRSIALIHEKLYRSNDLSEINLNQYIPSLAASLFNSFALCSNSIQLTTDIEPVSLNIDTAIHCGLIINELVSNSLKYAFPGQQQGEIHISLQENNDRQITIVVQDNGVGIANLADLAHSDSLGLKLVQDLVDQLEGVFQIHSNSGTAVSITFPR